LGLSCPAHQQEAGGSAFNEASVTGVLLGGKEQGDVNLFAVKKQVCKVVRQDINGNFDVDMSLKARVFIVREHFLVAHFCIGGPSRGRQRHL